jgi:uncharacterized lipoprotein NlpE involved in copper resistance
MKKILMALAFVSLSLGACQNSAKEKAAEKKQYKYVCSMHPEIGADKPGTCSKCSMELVKNDAVK